MKKLFILAIVVFSSIKITLYFNKKQAQKLIVEKQDPAKQYREKDMEEISKAMHKFESLKARMRKELKTNQHIISTRPTPIIQENENLYNSEENYKYFENEEENNEIENIIQEQEENQEELYEDEDELIEDSYIETEDDNTINNKQKAIKTIDSLKNVLKNKQKFESFFIKLNEDNEED